MNNPPRRMITRSGIWVAIAVGIYAAINISGSWLIGLIVSMVLWALFAWLAASS